MVRRVALCLSLGLICACSGDFYSGPDGTLSKENATTLKTQIQSAFAISLTSPAGAPTVSGSRASEFDDCTTSVPETATDADSDGIKATLTRTSDCTLANSTQKGTVVEIDKDDANAKAGFRYEYDLEGSYTQARNNENFVYDGFFDLTMGTDGGYTYTSNYQFEATNDYGSGISATYTGGSTWNHSLIPDAQRATSGTATLGGYYGWEVDVSGAVPSGTSAIDFVLEISSESLKYDTANCTNFFKSGSISMKDGDDNIVKWTYADCSAAPTVTYNGEAI